MSSESDKKRESEIVGPIAKRQKPMNVLSEEGPLTQQDVVYFKKEAIWRQMKTYKDKYNSLLKDLDRFREKYATAEKQIGILDLWYEEIVNVFDRKSDSGEVDQLLLIGFSELDPADMTETLEKRRHLLLAVLTPLFDNSLAHIKEEDLLIKVKEVSSDLAKLRSENNTITKLKQDLEKKVLDLNEYISGLLKDKERRNSKTVARIDESMNNGTEVKEETNEQPDEKNNESTNNDTLSVEKEEIERINQEAEELKTHNVLLQERIDLVASENRKLKEDLENTSLRLANLDANDLEKSAIYQQLLSTNNYLNETVHNLQKANDTAVNELNEMEKKQNNIIQIVSKDLMDENELLKSQLAKCESDLVRIRTIRDELISKQAILKSEIENQKTNEELNKMIDVLNKRINSLEESRHNNVDNANLSELPKEELIKQVSMVTSEIKEIEKVFQESRAITISKLNDVVDQQNLVKKLTIEKTKADQKYFAAMRAKDSLAAENRLLKAQVAKSQELINKFNDMEKTYLEKIEILNNSVNDFRVIKESSIQESGRLRELNQVLTSKKTLLEKECSYLKENLQSKNKEFLDTVKNLDDLKMNYSKLESKFKSTDLLLRKYKSNSTSLIIQEDEKQLQALRSIAKCSVCSKNWKDTAITACGHVFCHSCAQERLAARLRRCPTCNKGFSASDLLTIHL